MAITQTGSTQELDKLSTPSIDGTSATGSFSVTIPADAEMMHISVSGFASAGSIISANGTFSVGAKTSVGVGGDSNGGLTQAAAHYILQPSTGTQTFNWQWGGGAGTALSSSDVKVTITYWKGLDTASPTRSSGGAQASGTTATTSTLTAQSGDLIIAAGGTNDGANGNLTFSWSGATELRACTNSADFDASLATASPSGNQTVGFTATGADESAVAAWVFKPAAGGGLTAAQMIGIFDQQSAAGVIGRVDA